MSDSPYRPSPENPYVTGPAGSPANPYLGGDDDNAELDEAAPRLQHRSLDALPQIPLADDGAAVSVTPQLAADPNATVMAAPPVDPNATVMAAPTDDATVVSAPGATTVAAPGATTVAANPGATVMASPGAPTRAGATVAAPALHAIPDPMAEPASDPLSWPGAAPSGTAPQPVAPMPRPVPVDAQRAEMARRLMDADRGLYEDYDEGFGGAAKGGVMGERFLRSQHEKLRGDGRKKINPKRLRFWRWFRTIPILLMVLALALSWFFSEFPVPSIGRLFYPVSSASAIEQAASDYGVDPDLIAAVIKSESNWDSSALSSVGATGLMQVMPSTAQDLAARGIVDSSVYDPSNLTDPTTNIEYGTAYLAQLLKNTGSTEEAIAAYNAGPGATTSWKSTASDGDEFTDLIQYPETASYLRNVMSAYEQYQKLYPDGLTAS